MKYVESRASRRGTAVADGPPMTASPSKRFLRVTWLELGERSYYLVSRCDLCNLVVEREIRDFEHDQHILDVIGIELLGTKGCAHVNETVGSGIRPAYKRTPR